MRLNKLTFMLAGCILFNLVPASRLCGQFDGRELREHRDKEGNNRCCVVKTCPKGTYATICEEQKPDSIECLACEENWYMTHETKSDDNIRCLRKRKCATDTYGGQRIKDNGSTTENRLCECDLAKGFFNKYPGFEELHCVGPIKCPAGEELEQSGKCNKCRPGMYKEVEGYAMCIHWTDCAHLPGLQLKSNGNITHDSICSNITIELPPLIGEVKPEPESLPQEVLLGIIIGCVAIAILLAIIAAIFCHRQKRRSSHAEEIRQNLNNSEAYYTATTDVPHANDCPPESTPVAQEIRGPGGQGYLHLTMPPVSGTHCDEEATKRMTPDSGILPDFLRGDHGARQRSVSGQHDTGNVPNIQRQDSGMTDCNASFSTNSSVKSCSSEGTARGENGETKPFCQHAPVHTPAPVHVHLHVKNNENVYVQAGNSSKLAVHQQPAHHRDDEEYDNVSDTESFSEEEHPTTYLASELPVSCRTDKDIEGDGSSRCPAPTYV